MRFELWGLKGVLYRKLLPSFCEQSFPSLHVLQSTCQCENSLELRRGPFQTACFGFRHFERHQDRVLIIHALERELSDLSIVPRLQKMGVCL